MLFIPKSLLDYALELPEKGNTSEAIPEPKHLNVFILVCHWKVTVTQDLWLNLLKLPFDLLMAPLLFLWSPLCGFQKSPFLSVRLLLPLAKVLILSAGSATAYWDMCTLHILQLTQQWCIQASMGSLCLFLLILSPADTPKHIEILKEYEPAKENSTRKKIQTCFSFPTLLKVDMIPKSLSALFGTMYGKKASVSSAISLAKELPPASDAQVSGTLVLLLEFNPYQLDPCSHFVLK